MRKNFLLITLVTVLLVPIPAQAQSLYQAGLIVQFPDGRVETACVEFSEGEITGVDLLNRSGLLVLLDYSSGLGAKICKIGETGCNYPGEDCFCRCQGLPCAYWNYWLLKDGQWAYSPLGAGSRRLGDGAVDGWVWGDGGQPPPLLSLDEICQAEIKATEATDLAFTSPLETPTARPTAIQTPQPTAQPTATQALLPTATSPASPLSPPTARPTAMETPQPTAQPTATRAPLPTATSPASPLSLPTAITQPPASPTATLPAKVFIPATSGEAPASKTSETDLPPSPDRYVGFAGVLAALGLIALTVWRRRKGV